MIVATAVLVATLAALVPARGAARIPVLTALAGRRPLGAVPRRELPIALTVFAVGLGLLLLATAMGAEGGHRPAAVATVGAAGRARRDVRVEPAGGRRAAPRPVR